MTVHAPPYAAPDDVEEFVTVADVAAFAEPSGAHRLLLATNDGRHDAVPLFRPEELPTEVAAEVVAEHGRWTVPGPGLAYSVPGGLIGGDGYVVRNGAFWLSTRCYPAYLVQNFKIHAGYGRRGLDDAGAEVVRADGLVATAWHTNINYGHVLLEILPRLYLLSVLRARGCAVRLAVPGDVPGWGRALMRLYVPEAEWIVYDPDRQVVAPEVAVLTTMLRDDFSLGLEFNRMAEDLAVRLGTAGVQGSGRKVYFSRTKLRLRGWHALLNEALVEEVFEAAGFEVVHPQRLDLVAQSRLLRSAGCVAGEYGSALHNSLFAPLGCRVMSINRINWFQDMVARVRRQRMAYVAPIHGMRDWRLNNGTIHVFNADVDRLPEQIAAFLAA